MTSSVAFSLTGHVTEDGMKKVYRVTLSEEDRRQLKEFVQIGRAESGRKPSALKRTRARILLEADRPDDGPAWTDAQIAESVEVSAVGLSRPSFSLARWPHGREIATHNFTR